MLLSHFLTYFPFPLYSNKIKADTSVPASARYCAFSSTLNFTVFGCVWKGVGAHMYARGDHQSTSGTIPQERTALFLR